jgi:DNA-binding transcriptional LysR family regulator
MKASHFAKTTPMLNPARIDFVTLKLFKTVAQLGSITKGASACNLALSAASRRLSDFESAIGVTLLERTAQGVSLTASGHAALQHAVRLYQGYEHFGMEMSDYSRGIRGHVRLWANMSALTEFLPGALSQFSHQHPDIKLEIEEQLSGDVVRALIDGKADIGIFAENTPADGLSASFFKMDELVVLCSKKHQLSRFKSISFDKCLGHDFVGLNQGSSLLELTSRVAESHGQQLKMRIQVRSFDAMCQMIAVNMGIGVVPLGACIGLLKELQLNAIALTDTWSKRNLMLATAPQLHSSAAQLLKTHLLGSTF